MKTKGITYVRAKNVLSALAFLAAIPVSAQVNFPSQKNILFTGQDKRFATSFLNYYVLAEPVARQRHIVSMSFFSSFPVKNNDAAEEINYTGKHDAKNNLSFSANMNELNADNLEISFKPTSFTYPESTRVDVGIADYSTAQLIFYALALKQYAKKNDFDTTYAFLSNMGMLSDKKRFFIVNLVTMQIEQSGLVSQGRGLGRSRYDKQYSNIAGSKCTSLGRYKIMGKYNGSFGESYRMTGLDSSNANAYNRNVVLHSMGCIPDVEDLMPACISEGCPAVSVNFLSTLSKIIDSRKKPVLLWIFDSNFEEAVIEQRPAKNIVSESGYMAGNGYHTCSIHPHDNLGMQ